MRASAGTGIVAGGFLAEHAGGSAKRTGFIVALAVGIPVLLSLLGGWWWWRRRKARRDGPRQKAKNTGVGKQRRRRKDRSCWSALFSRGEGRLRPSATPAAYGPNKELGL